MKTQMKGGSSKTDVFKKLEERNLKKRKAAGIVDKERKRRLRKERKAKRDPNKPKRAPTPFFVFLGEFRKAFNASHPDNKSVAAVVKAGSDKWNAMSVSDKAPYVAKAEKKKAEYEKAIKAYTAKKTADTKKIANAGGERSSGIKI